MKIAISSDVHDNLFNLKKVLNYCRQNEIKTMINCGDLTNGETLDYLADNFLGNVFFSLGNADNDELRDIALSGKYKNIKLFSDFGDTQIAGSQVAFVHFPDKAQELCAQKKYDFVFYGHTHKPWEEKKEDCFLLNPGTVAGIMFMPTFAVWDAEKSKFELILINELAD